VNGASGNASDTAVISFDPSVTSGLASGTYNGVVAFVGEDETGGSQVASLSVSVTLSVGNSTSTSGGYVCSDNSCSWSSSGSASQADCDAACGEQQYSCVTGACALVTSGGTPLPECQANCDGGGGYRCENNSCAPVSPGGVSYSSCEEACGYPPPPPPGEGGYSCVKNACGYVPSGGTSLSNCEAVCSGVGGYSCENNTCKWATSGGTSLPDCQAACGPPPPPHACTSPNCQAVCSQLSATPPSITVVPEQTVLQSNCSNVTECQLSGGGLNETYTTQSNSISIDTSTAPSTSTIYTLTCENIPYGPSDSASTSVQVTVGNPNLCETNPYSPGCPPE
jgi:hypothetical protein